MFNLDGKRDALKEWNISIISLSYRGFLKPFKDYTYCCSHFRLENYSNARYILLKVY
jgi:hypothetical protein